MSYYLPRYIVTVYSREMDATMECATLPEAYATAALYGRNGRWRIWDMEAGAAVDQSANWSRL